MLAPVVVAWLVSSGSAAAQIHAVFDVPDSLLDSALRKSASAFENSWNSLLLGELRAGAARTPEVAALRSLARRVAAREGAVLGSRIAPDALELRDRWTPDQRRVRVRAAVAESLATSAQTSRDWPRADSLFNDALADYRLVGESRRIAWVLGSIGLVAFQSGDYTRADSVYRLALESRRALGDPRMLGNTLNSFGVLRYLEGKPAEARDWFEQARVTRESVGDRGPLGATLNYLGLVQRQLGHPDSARASFDRALQTTVAAGDSNRTAEVLVNTIGLLTDLGQHAEALPMGDRAALIYESNGNVRGEAQLQAMLGGLLRQQARFAEALDRYRHALDLGRSARDVRGTLTTLLSMGQVGASLGDPATGNEPLQAALSLADSLEDNGARAAALNNLALLAKADGDASSASRHAHAALAAAVLGGDSSLVRDAATTLAGQALDRGDPRLARAWYLRAAAASGKSTEERKASDLNNLAIAAILLDSLDLGERLCREAIELADRAKAPDMRWPPLLGLGEIAERRGDYARALALDREAASGIDALRGQQAGEAQSIALLSRRRLAAEALVHLLTRLQARFPDSAFVAEAFHWTERARARALADRLGEHSRPGGRLPLVELDRVRAELPSNRAAFLEYSLGDSSSSLWVITRRGVRHHMLPARSRLRSRIEALRGTLAHPSTASGPQARRAARALYRILLEPAEPMLRDVERLVISPDGALALVPFEALLVRDVGDDATAKARDYVVSRYAITYAPSASVYAALGGRRGQGAIVALGAPEFGSRPDLPALPNTALELDLLERLAGPGNARVLRGAQATRAALLAGDALAEAKLIHLATHGSASEFEPRRAGLWLAAAEGGAPGFLSLEDMAALRFRADLVTLSACETGVGRVASGEGVMGLPRAVLAAGAKSVLVSLWKVSDRSTAQLMERFYEDLLVRGRSADEALAVAKRALLAGAETSSPFHWAPFVLNGRYPTGP